MASAAFRIVPHKSGWGVEHDASVTGPYLTKEAAFEAAVGPASNAIKQGLDVVLSVPGRVRGESALGAR